ncbi:MAG: CpsD/CapB family tyrosine-protein kinase [Proteobacteria bacterium]|nr:CpsD/CapB family tyrosine-protein kinase [Pseudomonadota bacterium]
MADSSSTLSPGEDLAEIRPVVLTDPAGRRAEAIRALRTHIVAQHIEAGRRALAVCGPTPGVGCTFVAVNVAIALSQIGLQTLLIDADLRNPSVQRYLARPEGSLGLRELLSSDETTFTAALSPDVMPNLDVLHADPAGSQAQEILSTERFGTLIDSCLRDYDITIIDTPPANLCADAQRVCSVVGYGLIVARRNDTLIEDIKTFRTQLEQVDARVIGTVLTEG